jgi:tetratricopeptide (TPR) repeat protein
MAGNSVAIRTNEEPIELIPRGAQLPFPNGEDWGLIEDLRVPEQKGQGQLALRVELEGGESQLLFSEVWELPKMARPGDKLTLQYLMDENQILRFRLDLEKGTGHQGFAGSIENPFTHIDGGNTKRVDLEAKEERLRTMALAREERIELLEEISELKEELGFYEQALYGYTRLFETTKNANYLNRMGLIAGRMKDHVREEKYLRETARLTRWSGSLFNLALSLRSRQKLEEADATLDEAIDMEADAPYFVLRALIADKRGDDKRRDKALSEAMDQFDPIPMLNDWSLGWMEAAARMMNDKERIAQVAKARKKRPTPVVSPESVGQLPIKKKGL